ncbi:SRPBCC family protein [Alkalihalobacillus sp. 1P02AB]|uniref:SRPBCC family protein n=1 Tax=Alkalihalobacillus sp. 1P02AB TaxID=3132260 RepID=UPI0039A62350
MKEIKVYRLEKEMEAPLELVFDFMINDDKVALWSSLIVENRYEQEADKYNYKIGTKFTTVQKVGKKVVEAETVVTAYDPPYSIEMHATTKEGVSISKYTLERIGPNTNIVLEASMIASNRYYHMLYSVIGRLAKFMMDEEMNRLREVVEQEANVEVF